MTRCKHSLAHQPPDNFYEYAKSWRDTFQFLECMRPENWNRIPLHKTLLVKCESSYLPDNCFVFAYAVMTRNGNIRWYGVSYELQEPAELSHVVAYWDPENIEQQKSVDSLINDLSMLVKVLSRKLDKADPNNEESAKAIDFLQRKSLIGTPIRSFRLMGSNHGNGK